MDGETLAAEVGVRWASRSLPWRVKATLQEGRALSRGGCVTGVGAGGSAGSRRRSSSSCSPCRNVSVGAQRGSPHLAPSQVWLPDPCVQPARFLRQFLKQEVCCGVSLKKQAVTTGLSPGAGHSADGEPPRHSSCKYEFCYSLAFRCGFISKTGVFLASLSLAVAHIHQRLSAPNFLLFSGRIWEPALDPGCEIESEL